MKNDQFSDSSSIVTIESVIKLSRLQEQDILDALNLKGDQLQVVNVKNASLIAGIRVSYQGKIIDLSLQNRLNQVKG